MCSCRNQALISHAAKEPKGPHVLSLCAVAGCCSVWTPTNTGACWLAFSASV
jgi:hypothetical protein